MTNTSMRAFLGFVAGALAVLTFHQGLVEALHLAGLAPQAGYRVSVVLPFNVPLIVNLSFWGGVYGMVYGALRPHLRAPLWVSGLCLGLLAGLIGMFVFAPIRGAPVAHNWQFWPIARSLLVNGVWGLGVSLILPRLEPRSLVPTNLYGSHARHAA